MVDFVVSRVSAWWPTGFAACAVVSLTVQFAAFAQDGKTPTTKGGGTPQTARAEAGANAAGSEQDLPTPPIDPEHPLYLPLQEAYKARAAISNVKDYEAEFVKREAIGRKLVKTTMNLKLRHEPFSVYLKFVDPNAGREVIYVEGRNNNNLLVHEAGFKAIVGTMSLPPTGADAMTDNRYPVTMIGMQNLVDKVIKQWEAEGKLGEVKTQKYPDAKLPTGEECVAYESSHPIQRNQFKFHITRLWIDKKSSLPIRVEQLGFPRPGEKNPPIVEEYTYSKVRTNVPLSNRDFDKTNPNYSFP